MNILVVSDEEGKSAFVYDTSLEQQQLHFSHKEGKIIDNETGSEWNHLGECVDGQHLGKKLNQLQSYQQFVRAWIIFHPHTEFYVFNKKTAS